MARHMGRNLPPVKEKPPPSYPHLEKLGLSVHAQIRFKRPIDESWTKARLVGDNKDGSLLLINDNGWNCIMPQHCQIMTKGPKGGKKWVEVIQA